MNSYYYKKTSTLSEVAIISTITTGISENVPTLWWSKPIEQGKVMALFQSMVMVDTVKPIFSFKKLSCSTFKDIELHGTNTYNGIKPLINTRYFVLNDTVLIWEEIGDEIIGNAEAGSKTDTLTACYTAGSNIKREQSYSHLCLPQYYCNKYCVVK